ncbi:MAG: hypothetical protein N6V49_10335, partial [Serratia symbiotica]|nr:hypothetical protein [Serratia symbiotica]
PISQARALVNEHQARTNAHAQGHKCDSSTGTRLLAIGALTVLGVVFPPIIGFMLVVYYLLRSSRKILDDSQLTGKLPDVSVTIGWAAIG